MSAIKEYKKLTKYRKEKHNCEENVFRNRCNETCSTCEANSSDYRIRFLSNFGSYNGTVNKTSNLFYTPTEAEILLMRMSYPALAEMYEKPEC